MPKNQALQAKSKADCENHTPQSSLLEETHSCTKHIEVRTVS